MTLSGNDQNDEAYEAQLKKLKTVHWVVGLALAAGVFFAVVAMATVRGKPAAPDSLLFIGLGVGLLAMALVSSALIGFVMSSAQTKLLVETPASERRSKGAQLLLQRAIVQVGLLEGPGIANATFWFITDHWACVTTAVASGLLVLVVTAMTADYETRVRNWLEEIAFQSPSGQS